MQTSELSSGSASLTECIDEDSKVRSKRASEAVESRSLPWLAKEPLDSLPAGSRASKWGLSSSFGPKPISSSKKMLSSFDTLMLGGAPRLGLACSPALNIFTSRSLVRNSWPSAPKASENTPTIPTAQLS